MADAAFDPAVFQEDPDTIGDIDHLGPGIGSHSKLFHNFTPSLSL
jgi:hypothetical protein